MKNLLLCALGALSLLAVHPASAIIVARQVWEKTDNPSKTVEILSDVHADWFLGGKFPGEIDQKDLVLSNKLDVIALQQKKDILWSALLYKHNVHVWVEDLGLFIRLKPLQYSLYDKDYDRNIKISRYIVQKNYLLMRKSLYNVCVLSGLSGEFKRAKVPCTNIEFRDGCDYADIEKEVIHYDDGLLLNNYYKILHIIFRNADKEIRADDYLFNARLVHNVATCDAQHQIVVAGGSHGEALAVALPMMGYRLRKSVDVHPVLQAIMSTGESDLSGLESIVQKEVALRLKPKTVIEHCAASIYSKRECSLLTSAFCMTHPIDIRTIVEQERKEAAASRAAASPLPSAPAVVLAPRVDAIALASALVMPALRARL